MDDEGTEVTIPNEVLFLAFVIVALLVGFAGYKLVQARKERELNNKRPKKEKKPKKDN